MLSLTLDLNQTETTDDLESVKNVPAKSDTKKNPTVRSNSQTTTAETDERHISGSCEMKPIFLRVVELNKHLTLLRLQKNHLLRCKLIYFNFKKRFLGVTVTPTTERNVFGGDKLDLSNC